MNVVIEKLTVVKGRLDEVPEVGSRLAVFEGAECVFLTSKILKVERVSGDEYLIETKNSRYRVYVITEFV